MTPSRRTEFRNKYNSLIKHSFVLKQNGSTDNSLSSTVKRL